MPRTTIRQRWSVIALIALNRTGMRAPAIFRRIGIPRRAVYGVLRRHAVWPNDSQISLAVADPARGCVSNDCKLDLVDITEA